MRNGKVRIYELSRELNLDNKDILAVCDRLNIPVKSHSSTITESDAERINKYIETNPAPAPVAAAPHSALEESTELVKEKKKQKILEIRKPKGRTHQNSMGERNQKPQQSSVQLASPPKALTPSTPSVKPTVNSPVPPQPAPPSQPVASPSGSQENPEVQQPAPAKVQPQSPSNVKAPEPPQIIAQPPKLSGPPPRPSASSTSTPPSSGLVTRDKPLPKPKPTPKSAESIKLKKAKDSDSSPSGPKSKRNRAPKPIEAKAGEAKDRSPRDKDRDTRKPREIIFSKAKERDKEIAAPKPKLPELQAPRRPAKPVVEEELDSIDETENGSNTENEEVLLDDDLSLEAKRPKRPAPPKKSQPVRPKRAAQWEEEEEDPAEAAKKAAKVKAKRPRKMLIEDDDDDEFNTTANSTQNIEAISLSLARPAKPKGLPGQNKPPQSSPSKPKKPELAKSNRESGNNSRKSAAKQKSQRPEILMVSGPMTVQEIAAALDISETDIIRRLFSQGVAVNITETLDIETIGTICEAWDVLMETEEEKSAAEKSDNILDEADLEHLQLRPPVVTIMGHVDHGKTTLLDAIRQTKVAQGEAGGITQHIGAYHVDVEHEDKMQQVVFLDTPGHEAFTAMRARGTKVTDIAILVVAADDGVRPQTIEAISHAKAAGVPIVVAINKIDKEEAQPDRVKQELMEHNLVPEEWGGDTIMVPVSAIQGENLDALLEMILLVSEVEDLEANPNRPAKGTIIEAHLDKARGPVASLLVQNGTLRVGDIVVAGSALGKVRAMVDDRGQRVEAASPSFAVEVLGLRDVPEAGDEFDVFDNEREAAALAEKRAQAMRQTRILQGGRVSLSALSARAQEGELKELNIILKADVQGSVEAIVNALKKLPQKEVQLQMLLSAPGEITETDVDLAAASDAVLIAFNTTLAHGARQVADQLGIDIREYSVIYNLLDDVQAAMEGLLEPELVEEPLGQAEVRAVFPVGRGQVAGCYILSGKVIRNCKMRVHRKNRMVYEGVLDSLKRMKDDVKEVTSGYECGIGADHFNNWNEGDIIEAYRMTTKRRTLSV